MATRAAKLATTAAMHPAGIFSDMSVDGPEIGTLVVVVDRAKNLPNRRTMGKQDPYCAARLGKEAKKTETDLRGGQVPRWDQELRFTVHDSPDYYKLKVSVFNEDKRTDLVGETWISLTDVILPGGGQSDLWHGLEYKGKYAGEIRIELTYYDTRPRVDKARNQVTATAKSAQNGPTPDAQSVHAGGPRELPAVKRRPLPSHPQSSLAQLPSSSHSTPVPTTTPRSYHTPPHYSNGNSPYSQERDLQLMQRADSQHEIYPQDPSSSYEAPEYHVYHRDTHHDRHRQSLQEQNHHPDPYSVRFTQPEDHLIPRRQVSGQQRQPSYNRVPPPLPHSHSAPAAYHLSEQAAHPRRYSDQPLNHYNAPVQNPVFYEQPVYHQTPPPAGPEPAYDQAYDYQHPRQHSAPPPPTHRFSMPPNMNGYQQYEPQAPQVDRHCYQSGEQPRQYSSYAPERTQSYPPPERDVYRPLYPTSRQSDPQYYPQSEQRHYQPRQPEYPPQQPSYYTQPPRPVYAHENRPTAQALFLAGPEPAQRSSHSAVPLIKPRAISPNRMPRQPTQASVAPMRKPVTPVEPSTPVGMTSGEIPFSPDSYEAFNPRASNVSPHDPNSINDSPVITTSPQATTTPDGRIIGPDGRVIDPSDHLPSHSWAPEPDRKDEPGSKSNTGHATFKARLGPRDAKPSTARPKSTSCTSTSTLFLSENTPPATKPASKTITATFRTRLQKSSPLTSTAPLQSLPHTNSPYPPPPPIPAKIPFSHSDPNANANANNNAHARKIPVEDYEPGGEMSALSWEVLGIDIGAKKGAKYAAAAARGDRQLAALTPTVSAPTSRSPFRSMNTK